MAVTKRQRREDRDAGVNARLARRGAQPPASFGDVPQNDPRFHDVMEETLDRIRYGDCNGFGAPEARERDRRRRTAF